MPVVPWRLCGSHRAAEEFQAETDENLHGIVYKLGDEVKVFVALLCLATPMVIMACGRSREAPI